MDLGGTFFIFEPSLLPEQFAESEGDEFESLSSKTAMKRIFGDDRQRSYQSNPSKGVLPNQIGPFDGLRVRPSPPERRMHGLAVMVGLRAPPDTASDRTDGVSLALATTQGF